MTLAIGYTCEHVHQLLNVKIMIGGSVGRFNVLYDFEVLSHITNLKTNFATVQQRKKILLGILNEGFVEAYVSFDSFKY